MIKKQLDLIAARETSNLEEASSITEVKLLLQESEREDISFVQNAFPISTNSRVISSNAEYQNVKKLSDLHNGDVFTTEQLKSICMKYRLKFLPSQFYKGNIPIDVIHDIKNKMESTSKLKYLSGSSSLVYGRSLFMMAPAEMFNMDSVISKKRSELAEIKRLRELDPAVFIKVDDDKYLFVREFGNSFSFLRRILGALTADMKVINTTYFLMWLLGMYLYKIWVLSPINSLVHSTERGSGSEFLSGIAFIVALGAGGLFFVGAALSGDNSFVLNIIKERKKNWFRLDKRFSTEHSWNER